MPVQINGTSISWYVIIFILTLFADASVKYWIIDQHSKKIEDFDRRIQELEKDSAVNRNDIEHLEAR